MSVPVFVTGGTGLLGERVVRRLAEAGHTVFALVRPKSRKTAEHGLKELRQVDPETAGRIVLVDGDLQSDGWIHADKTRTRVRREARAILHAGASTHWASEPSIAWDVNVDGTARVLGLADGFEQLDRLVHISSAAVCGIWRGPFGVDDLGSAWGTEHQRSKAEGERLVRDSSLPWTIVRPAHLVGESTTGAIDRVDGVYHLLLLLIRLGRWPIKALPVAPGGDRARIDVVPVDIVARAVVALLEAPQAHRRCLHLTDPGARTVRGFVKACADELGIFAPLVPIPGGLLARTLRGRGLLHDLADQLLSLPPELADGLAWRAVHETAESTRLLGEVGVSVPPLESYLPRTLDHARRRLL